MVSITMSWDSVGAGEVGGGGRGKFSEEEKLLVNRRDLRENVLGLSWGKREAGGS